MTSKRNGIAVGFLIALLIFSVSVWQFYTEYTASTWTVVSGKIASSGIVIEGSRGIFYRADIKYSYNYSGQDFLGSCCKIGTNSRSAQQAIIDRNPPGATVEILVNPADSSQSRLREDVRPFHILYMVGMFLGGVGILALGHKLLNPSSSS